MRATESDQQDELRAFVDAWTRSLLEKDLDTARALRDEGYRARSPDGRELSRAQEVEMIGSAHFRVDEAEARDVRVRQDGDEARIDVAFYLRGQWLESPIENLRHVTIRLRRTDGRWRATDLFAEDADAIGPGAPKGGPREGSARWKGLVPAGLRRWLAERRGRRPASGASFQELVFRPHRPGSDYVLPPRGTGDEGPGRILPVPPKDLWLGYDYPAQGKLHVDRMLEILGASGFAFEPGDRILDLGCGAGRMIRHLQALAETCEIWGADISADHIFWCKRNLSPPFHFVTTTKVPHLPFEDRSFRLVYGASLFTHIDDLADAWLLELHRILAPGGRAYVTIHDNATIELFEDSIHAETFVARRLKASPAYQEAKAGFGMFTVGRDDESKVFYDRAYFSDMVRPMFELLSVTPAAYFYQTAYLLGRTPA